jgi:hypothetical protein
MIAQWVYRLSTDWMFDHWEFEFLYDQKYLPHVVHNVSGAHPASCIMGTGVTCTEIKQPGREIDHLSPTSTEVKKTLLLVQNMPPTNNNATH